MDYICNIGSIEVRLKRKQKKKKHTHNRQLGLQKNKTNRFVLTIYARHLFFIYSYFRVMTFICISVGLFAISCIS